MLSVEAPFGQAVLLETIVLSILNHDSAVAAAASLIAQAAGGRPVIEMGSRRTDAAAAVAAARAAYLGGFASTSNLEAGRRYGVPTAGTVAHAFILSFGDERAAFEAQAAGVRARHHLPGGHLRRGGRDPAGGGRGRSGSGGHPGGFRGPRRGRPPGPGPPRRARGRPRPR